jgi:predicted enzyme related to lactoylglutathione lyase
MPAVRLSSIKQIAIPVNDVEKAKMFYKDVLGMAHLFDAPPALSFFDCGGVRLMLSGPAAQGKDGDRQHAVLFYDVSDIKTSYAAIRAAGAPSFAEPRIIARMNGREVWIAELGDGQGNALGLISEVAES